MKKRFLFLFFGLFVALSSTAQILKKLGDRASRKIENAVNKKIDNAIDKTLDEITNPKPSEKSPKPKKEAETPAVKTPPPGDNKPVTKVKGKVESNVTFEQSGTQGNCEKQAEKRKGSWKQTKVYNYDHPTPNEKRFTPNMDKVMNAIADLVMEVDPAPVGSNVEWEKWFTRTGDSVSTPDPLLHTYQFVGQFLPFICKYGKAEPYGITDTWLFIRVNGFQRSEITLQNQINSVFGDKVFSLGKQVGTLGGYPYFKPAPTGIRKIPEVVYNSVLVHRSGKLPFIPVTRGELLNMCRKWLELVESGKLKSTENIALMRSNLDKLFNQNKSEIDKPAIIRKPEWDFNDLGTGDPDKQNIFTTIDDGYQLFRPDHSYVDQSVSKWRPQFMMVTWYKASGKPNSEELDKVMREQFDFKKLGAMIN
ncbi:MAG: hypothetical protein H3C48_12275 [Chitinophagaceae bacterium]|nr:hypothetical protein [Chitinophagaceae bacterium]